jgi:glyoxylase-like metal-dependent hydrolase (beta-lactamase superfamily II)
MTLKAIATPGHTGESVCYLVNDAALLTGDTLFADGVGRPDLEKGHAGAPDGARALYGSLRERILKLPDETIVLPGHCDPHLPFGAPPVQARLGDLKSKISLLGVEEAVFVDEIIQRLGGTPPNHGAIIAVNEGKADLIADPAELEMGPNRCAVK